MYIHHYAQHDLPLAFLAIPFHPGLGGRGGGLLLHSGGIDIWRPLCWHITHRCTHRLLLYGSTRQRAWLHRWCRGILLFLATPPPCGVFFCKGARAFLYFSIHLPGLDIQLFYKVSPIQTAGWEESHNVAARGGGGSDLKIHIKVLSKFSFTFPTIPTLPL